MILGLGTDIVENSRIAKLYRRYGQQFLERLFTEEEIDYALSHNDPVPYLAARFAVKEAVVKALSFSGNSGLNWKDVEVAGKIFGKKKLVFRNRALKAVNEVGANRYHISISHTHNYSTAVVILEQLKE